MATRHAGWSETLAYANIPQDLQVGWRIDPGGEAVLEAREAWTGGAAWRELDRWGQGTRSKERGERAVAVTGPTLLRLRARAGKFPRSGVAHLFVRYSRRTIAVLRGGSGRVKRPIILAEGYDPFNIQDWNDPDRQESLAFGRLLAEGRARHDLDAWVLDWGDGGAPLEQQAKDFAEIARQVQAWNGDRRNTVAVGVSMGSVSLRYALATAARTGGDLGVQKYISINGPHQGAWVNPKLLQFLLRRAADVPIDGSVENPEAFLIRRGLGSPAAQELLIGGARHTAFYADLRSRGVGGYHPRIPRVAFSNGTLVREGNDLADLVQGKADVVHRVAVRPLWLPFWLTVHRARREFRYGAYPGELLPASLRQPAREHVRFLGVFRFDIRARWEGVPTFIPTHSALDFSDELSGGPPRYRYSQWRSTPFTRVYVTRDRNLPHDDTRADWIDPRTGKGAPPGQNAVLYEIARSFGPEK